MKVLIVSTNLSHPTDAGNRAAIMGQVRLLQQLGCEIHFLYVDMALRQFDESEMRNYWGEQYHVFHQNFLGKCWRLFIDKFRTHFCNGYWSCDDHYAHGLSAYVNKLDQKYHFDAVIIQYMRLSRLLPKINIPRKAIYTHDVFSYKDLRVGGPFYETCNAQEEAKALQRCPNIFSIQEEEASYYSYLAPQSRIYTVYNPYECHNLPAAKNKSILYLASRMDFNFNGIIWFLENIWGKVVEQCPDVQLIIGGTVCEKIEAQKYPNISLVGRVESLDSFYKLGDIVINPVYQGTGLKIKTFEALSYGKTTIVHPHSTKGIFRKEKAPLLIAEAPKEWINILTHLLSNGIDTENQQRLAFEYINQMDDFIKNQYQQFLS